MSGIPRCVSCKTRRVAWIHPRVAFCYTCLPGGPFTPPPCRRCGSTKDYFTAGLCQVCHRFGEPGPQSCPDCYAWGTIRKFGWLCRGCYGFRQNHRPGRCVSCRREVSVNADSVCRLCWRQASMLEMTTTVDAVIEANRWGQQLFLADMHQSPNGKAALYRRVLAPAPPQQASPLRVNSYRQPLLFDLPRELAAGRRRGLPPPPDPQQAALLDQRLREHAAKLGWSDKGIKKARRALAVVLGLTDAPGAPVLASLIYQLPTIELPARPIAEFLDGLGLLEDDRIPAIQLWFANQVAGLPAPMLAELTLWSDVLLNGRTTPPRSRPRAPHTVQIKLRWAMPTLRGWAAAGIRSLREISREHILDILPRAGNPRYTTGAGLRAIFKVLKVHKVVFVDPTFGLQLGHPERRTPLPANLGFIREGLTSPDPTRAALTALLAFHALRTGQLRHLQLTEIHDGRLHLTNQTILLAEPVRVRLAVYLNYRNQRWPNTANPHLFIHERTAHNLKPVGARWPGLVLGTAARVIRTDRIVDEVLATNGDLRRICDLFGLSIAGASRYTAVLGHPDLTGAVHG